MPFTVQPSPAPSVFDVELYVQPALVRDILRILRRHKAGTDAAVSYYYPLF